MLLKRSKAIKTIYNLYSSLPIITKVNYLEVYNAAKDFLTYKFNPYRDALLT